MSQNNASSNEANWSFAAPAPPSGTPGSGDSGGGGTTSWVAFGSIAHSGTSVGQAKLLQGVDHRDRLWQDQRGPSRPAIEDKSNVGPSANIPRSNGASPSAGTAKHKSSHSATRGESELRKQLLHVSNEMDKSEKARFELEERVKLFEDAARHRNEAMCEMEIYLEIIPTTTSTCIHNMSPLR